MARQTRVITKTRQINILSIDPSTTCTGWALFTCDEKWRGAELGRYGKIRPKGDTLFDRRADLVCELVNVPEYGLECIDYVFIEKAPLPFTPAARRSIAILQGTIDILHQDISTEIPLEQIFGVNAMTWKKTEKKPRTLSRCNLVYSLGLKGKKDYDIADAIMMGIWIIKRMQVAPLLPFYISTC